MSKSTTATLLPPTMMLISSTWGNNNSKTFKLIPVASLSPYNECIFDSESKVLAVISKEKKESFHMLPKLNEMGDIQALKIGRRPNGKDFAEERKALDTYYEYYIEDKNEIVEFINRLAINADTFDYQTYLDNAFDTKTESSIVTMNSVEEEKPTKLTVV